LHPATPATNAEARVRGATRRARRDRARRPYRAAPAGRSAERVVNGRRSCRRSCRGRRRAELHPTDLAGWGLVAGAEPEVAHDVATGLGDVPGEALEEVLERERHRLGSPVAVIGVAEHDTVSVESEQTAVRDRPAAQIATEVAQHAVCMGVALLDPGVPRAAAEQPEEALDADASQRRERLAAEERPHDADREEEAVAHRPPTLWREPAARHEAVDMEVEGQRAAPGVEHCEDAGPSAEETIVAEKCQKGISDASKEQRVHPAPIVVPERQHAARSPDGAASASCVAALATRRELMPGRTISGASIVTGSLPDLAIRITCTVSGTRRTRAVQRLCTGTG